MLGLAKIARPKCFEKTYYIYELAGRNNGKYIF